jgi:hypothetical protein
MRRLRDLREFIAALGKLANCRRSIPTSSTVSHGITRSPLATSVNHSHVLAE